VGRIPYSIFSDPYNIRLLDFSASESSGGRVTDRHPISVKLCLRHKRAGERTGERTDAANLIRCILALKRDIWWQHFNDFPDNQLTKVRVFIG